MHEAHPNEDYDKDMQDMSVSDEWMKYPQINNNIEDDRLTAYIFGRPVKIFEDNDGEIGEEFKFRGEANIKMVKLKLYINYLYLYRPEVISLKSIRNLCKMMMSMDNGMS